MVATGPIVTVCRLEHPRNWSAAKATAEPVTDTDRNDVRFVAGINVQGPANVSDSVRRAANPPNANVTGS
jgi:hypothetical protein